jgi:malate/lactate dehydrogenase
MEFLGVIRSAYLEGECRFHDFYIGISVKSGQNGIEEIIQIAFTDVEQKALRKPAGAVKQMIKVVMKLKQDRKIWQPYEPVATIRTIAIMIEY